MQMEYIAPRDCTKPVRTPEVLEVNWLVALVVRDHAILGKTKLALAAAADILLMGARRTRGHYHNEIAVVTPDQLADVRTAYAGYLRQRQGDLEAEIAQNAAWLASREGHLLGAAER